MGLYWVKRELKCTNKKLNNKVHSKKFLLAAKTEDLSNTALIFLPQERFVDFL
jgi:hypothetical protein